MSFWLTNTAMEAMMIIRIAMAKPVWVLEELMFRYSWLDRV